LLAYLLTYLFIYALNVCDKLNVGFSLGLGLGLVAQCTLACRKKAQSSLNFQTSSHMEAHNFEVAQYIVKQITDVSSTINVLEDGTKLGGITPWEQLREKIVVSSIHTVNKPMIGDMAQSTVNK